MARRNATDRTPAALTDFLDYIEENTGLMGEANPGKAHLSAGGTTLMIMSDRPRFDSHSLILKYINTSNRLSITNIAHRSCHDKVRAYIEVKVE